ncbi:MAG: minor capsid protein [Bacillota bacterium]|jgi:SPP1 gp7 family putative phage head morphogenesis protein
MTELLKRSAAYWTKRSEDVARDAHQTASLALEEINKEYTRAMHMVDDKISRWYTQFAKNNKIPLAEAHKRLSAGELKEFKWTLEEYIARGQEAEVNGKWIQQLENAAARVHISRLEALKIEMQQAVEVLYAREYALTDEVLRKILDDTYYRTAFNVQKGVGAVWSISPLDVAAINRLIKTPWAVDGLNFSDRIWRDKQTLIGDLQSQLMRNLMTGETPYVGVKDFAAKFGVKKHRAAALLDTETTYFVAAGQKEAYKELDVEAVEVVETLDDLVCTICQEMDGKVVKMADYSPGVTVPPFHTRCRGTTCPHFDDEFSKEFERAARGADGEIQYVKGDMTYQEWYKNYVLKESDWQGIIGVEAQNGLTIEHINPHLIARGEERAVEVSAAIEALKTPLHITEVSINASGKPSIQFIGQRATVAVNPETKTLITTWKTGKSRIKKYGKGE